MILPDNIVPRTEVRRVSVHPVVVPRNGAAFAEEPAITLSASAWEKICEHAESDMRSEVGGLLIGELFNDAVGHAHVVITQAISASETVATAASVVFTLDTWEQLLERKAAELGNEAIVGWYHTHPGFGVFLSSWDVFLHRSFFPRPWHLALVVDPIGRSAAFFLTTPETVIRRDGFNLRLDGSKLCWKGLADSNPLVPVPLDGALVTQGQLCPILQLEQSPSAIAAKGEYLCAALSSNGLAVKNVSETLHRFLHLPDNHEVDEVVFDDRGKLYILSREHSEIWRLDLSKQEQPIRLKVEGYTDWETSDPAGLAVVQKKIAIWDDDRLLLFELDGEEDCLRLVSKLEISGVRVGQTLLAFNYQIAVSGPRLLINMPQSDAISVVSLETQPTQSMWHGAVTGLRHSLAIAASEQRVFALDSEGARLIVLNLSGTPQEAYFLESALREHSAIGLAATTERLYLAFPNGVFELELPTA